MQFIKYKTVKDEIHIQDDLTVLFSKFFNFKLGCIYSDKQVDIKLNSCVFEENSNFHKAACLNAQNARTVNIEKCFGRSCQTNYNGNPDLYFVGQFCFLYDNSQIGIQSCAFTSCAPDYDKAQQRRSTIECGSDSINIEGINFSYNQLYAQVAFLDGNSNLDYITFYHNTVDNWFQRDMTNEHIDKHIQYIDNTIFDTNIPILLYAYTDVQVKMLNCVFYNIPNNCINLGSQATVHISSSWFSGPVPVTNGLTVENNGPASQPSELSHLSMRALLLEMENQRRSCERTAMCPFAVSLSFSLFCKNNK